jgi:Fic family protein
MNEFGQSISQEVQSLNIVWGVPDAIYPRRQKLIKLVEIASAFFVRFLTVHPYINGNGHLARAIVIAILARYRIFPRNWRVEPRPDEPDYTNAIVNHRNGHPTELVKFILSRI